MPDNPNPQRVRELNRQRGYGEHPDPDRENMAADQASPGVRRDDAEAGLDDHGVHREDRAADRTPDRVNPDADEADGDPKPLDLANNPVKGADDPRHPNVPDTHGADTGPIDAQEAHKAGADPIPTPDKHKDDPIV